MKTLLMVQYFAMISQASFCENVIFPHTSKEVDTSSVAPLTPSMPTTREWAIRARDSSPFILIDQINEEVIVEGSKSSVKILATEKKQLFAI